MYNSQEMVDRIKKISSQKGISITKLHEMCGLSRNVLSQAAKSTEGIKSRNLCTIADALGCSVDYLLGRTDNPNAGNVMNSGDIMGDNNIQANGNVSFSTHDELSEELFRNFNMLTTTQKARIIVMIDEMRKGA